MEHSRCHLFTHSLSPGSIFHTITPFSLFSPLYNVAIESKVSQLGFDTDCPSEMDS